MRSGYLPERKSIQRIATQSAIRRQITMIENRIAECERFYPWPALVQSLQADIEMLRARLNDPAH